VYIGALIKECRKSLTTKLEREYKGLPFDSIEPVIRKEVVSWFGFRDRNIELNHDESEVGKLGELHVTYLGSTKETRFKIHINSLFTLAGSSSKSLSYLKSLNLSVDKREFNKK
jgi:hypothetical protein